MTTLEIVLLCIAAYLLHAVAVLIVLARFSVYTKREKEEYHNKLAAAFTPLVFWIVLICEFIRYKSKKCKH